MINCIITNINRTDFYNVSVRYRPVTHAELPGLEKTTNLKCLICCLYALSLGSRGHGRGEAGASTSAVSTAPARAECTADKKRPPLECREAPSYGRTRPGK